MSGLPQEKELQFRGVVLDLPPDEVPDDYWSFGDNVFFRDLATVRVGGLAQFWSTTGTLIAPTSGGFPQAIGDTPVYITPIQQPELIQWIVVAQNSTQDGTNVFLYDGQSEVPLTGATYPHADPFSLTWQSTDHNGIIVLNDGVSTPRYVDLKTNQLVLLPDWPVNVSCRSIVSFKYHLFALGLTGLGGESPYQYLWSDASNPGEIPQGWTPTASGDAGDNQIAHPQGEIVDGIVLRDSLMILKQFSAHIVQFVGGLQVFNLRDLYISAGTMNVRCATEVNGFAYICTQDDFIRTDGNSMESVCTHQVRKAIFENIEQTALRWTHVVKRHLYDEIWLAFGLEGATYCNKVATYNVRTGRWGFRSLPIDSPCLAYGLVNLPGALISWDQQTENWNDTIRPWNQTFFSANADEVLGAFTNYIGIFDRGSDWVGLGIVAEVRREGVKLDDRSDTVKLVTEIWPHVVGTTGTVIEVSAGGTYSEDDPISWCTPVPYVIGQGQQKIDITCAGRLHGFRFRSTGGDPWRMFNFRVRYVQEGRF